MTVLILGIGNAWASDDGVGPEVVQRLRGRLAEKVEHQDTEVEFVTVARPDVLLLDHFAGLDRLVIVDAVVSGAPPGTLYREIWQPGALDTRGVERASSHGFGVRELLDMASALGKCPPRVELWGVEIASTEAGEGLTPEVAAAVPDLVEALARMSGSVLIPGKTAG